MLFLSKQEGERWIACAQEALAGTAEPHDFDQEIRPNLIPAFDYFVGTTLVAKGLGERGQAWCREGVLLEEDGLFSNGFLLNFLKRQNGSLVMPAVAFADPRPFVHFAGVPTMKSARERFLKQCGHSLPRFQHPLRILDIGTGNGALVVQLVQHLQECGKVGEVGEILLVDPSPAMCALAEETVAKEFPRQRIRTVNARIQDLSDKLDARYDVALASLAFHHMPYEDKEVHLSRLEPWIDHFLLFELNANNDLPAMHSPELALSVYQSYGRMMDFVFSHDAPVEVALACIDLFLMTEAVSLLTQPRGIRSDYHLLRWQWKDLLDRKLGPAFACGCDSLCYADEYLDLFTLHYQRV